MKGLKTVDTISPETKTPVRSRRSLPWGGWLAGLGLLALLVFLGLGLYHRSLSQVQSGTAPDFELTTFDGQTIRLSALRGQVVVINFWASWCQPCRQEAPILEGTWREYRD